MSRFIGPVASVPSQAPLTETKTKEENRSFQGLSVTLTLSTARPARRPPLNLPALLGFLLCPISPLSPKSTRALLLKYTPFRYEHIAYFRARQAWFPRSTCFHDHTKLGKLAGCAERQKAGLLTYAPLNRISAKPAWAVAQRQLGTVSMVSTACSA